MKTRNIIFWVLAVIITLASAYYQRITGPTYELSGSESFQGKDIIYKFERSHSISSDCPVIIPVTDDTYKGTILWKRNKTNDELTRVEMKIYKDTVISDVISDKLQKRYFLYGTLPKQPPAGKLNYYVRLVKDNSEKVVPEKEPVTIRFKGDVPTYILIIHVIVMFASMLFATRTGLEIFMPEPKYTKYLLWTLGTLIIGGLVRGPIVQKYAFGEYWTGIPFGIDLTDNKTLIAFIGWLAAFIMYKRSQKPKLWIIGAAILMLIVYLIPHSVLGSELDYNQMK